MIAHARHSVLLIDASKLEGRGLIAIAPLSAVTLVLATGVSGEQAIMLEASGTAVRVAPAAVADAPGD